MIKLPRRSMIVDVSNILFRVAAVQKHKNPFASDADPEDLVGLCMHISLMSIFKWYNKFHPDFVVFAFEGANNWRKKYTEKTKARLQYKGNRVVDPEMAHYYELITSFHATIKAHTSICCLSVPTMEADDVIAGFCQLYADPSHEIIIVSGDRDFIQLLSLPGVKLINPDNGKPRNQPGDKEYEPDIDFWLFNKCVRGDMGDYVPSAYPRVRETKIRQAYTDDYAKMNFMNTEWIETLLEHNEDGTPKTVKHRVGDLFEENKVLLSLFNQPADVRERLLEGIKEQVASLGTYSHFHFLRFLRDYKLQRVQDEAMKFVDLFANNQRFLKGERQQATTTTQQVVEPTSSSLLEF